MNLRKACLGLILLALHPLYALPSDALLDSLSVASADQEKAGQLAERDKTESLLETLSRQRVVADSAANHPHKVMEQIERLRAERTRQESQEQASLRKPPAEVQKMLDSDTGSNSDTTQAHLAPKKIDSIPAALPNASTTICASGSVRVTWLPTSSRSLIHEGTDSIFPLKVRIDAPCGLSRIDLFVDESKLRSFPVPTGKVGNFEFSDAIALAPGIHRLDIVACDSTGICTRSVPLESRLTNSVPPWIPKAVGVLVGLCVLLGLALSLRKLSHHPTGQQPNHAFPLPESSGISATIRYRLQLVAKEIGPSFPAVSLRLPDAPPRLSVDPESLGEAFCNIMRLHARRTSTSGQILIAMGHGPLSAEIVIEDTATSPDDSSIPLLLDPSKAHLKERMELDQELESARQMIVKAKGSISMEARIDGGLRTRVRLKLATQKGKA